MACTCVLFIFVFAQTLSQAEHCIALEEKLNIQSPLHDNYVNVYLNHFEKCQPPIEYQFPLYQKLLNQLLKKDFSPAILESTDRVIQHILDQIPLPDTESLQEFAHENWQTLSEQRDHIAFHIPPFAGYNFEKPLSITQDTQK